MVGIVGKDGTLLAASLAAFAELGWKARVAASDALEFIAHERQDVIVANLFLLMCVSFIPFPTSVLSEHLRHGGHDQTTAAIFYSGTFTVTAAFYNLLWRVAATNDRLIKPGCEEAAAEVTRRYRYGVPTYLAATLVAVISVPASLAIDGALALFYILPSKDPT